MDSSICEIEIPYNEKLNLQYVQVFIQEEADKQNLPICMQLLKNRILISHPSHPNDYFNFEVTMWKEFNSLVIRLSATGHSKQYKKHALNDVYKEQLTHSYVAAQLDLSSSNEYLIRSTINKFRSLGYNEDELLKENRFYDSLISVFKTTFGA